MTDAPDRPLLGAAYMLGASVAFAALGAVVKVAATHVPSVEIVFWRSLFSAAFVAVGAAAAGASLRPTNLRMHGVRAAVGVASMACYFEAIARLPLGDAVLITYLSPLLVALASPLLGERPPPRIWGALAVGLVGVALVAGPAGADDPVGLGCAFAAAFFAAGAYLSVRQLTRTDPPTGVVFWFGVFGAALMSPALAWGGGVHLGVEGALVEMLAIGLLGAVAQTLMTRAYSVAAAARVSVVQYSTPVFAYALGLWVLGDPPSTWGIAGAALVALAGALSTRG